MNDRQHELRGHIPFDQIMIETESNIWVGSFDGWFEADNDGSITTLWLSSFDGNKYGFAEYRFPASEGHWLASKVRNALEEECAEDILEAIRLRTPHRLEADPGPMHSERV